MKKTLFVTALSLVIATSAFADNGSADLATGSASGAGASIYGGSTSAIAKAAATPIVKLSTGVKGLANYSPTAYSVFTKHGSGSKIFGTANDSTSVYWSASPSTVALASGVTGTTAGNGNFTGGSITWTTY